MLTFKTTTVSLETSLYHLFETCYEEDVFLYTSHALFPLVIEVRWTESRMKVAEGDGEIVRLSGEAVGIYAKPIAIGVFCTEINATDVEPGIDISSTTLPC